MSPLYANKHNIFMQNIYFSTNNFSEKSILHFHIYF